MKSIWTVNGTSYQEAKDNCDDGYYRAFSPFAVCKSRQDAEKKVMDTANEMRDPNEDDLLTVNDMKWADCRNTNMKVQWQFYDAFDESFYFICEFEIKD